LTDPPGVAAGKPPTAAQRRAVYDENLRRNNGVLRDDSTGEVLVPGQKSQRGVTPPPNEAQIDHIIPANPADPAMAPGTNSYKNLRVVSRRANRDKSNK
jgi:filamentous hemagglutinin